MMRSSPDTGCIHFCDTATSTSYLEIQTTSSAQPPPSPPWVPYFPRPSPDPPHAQVFGGSKPQWLRCLRNGLRTQYAPQCTCLCSMTAPNSMSSSGVGRWQSSEVSRALWILPPSLIPTPSPWWAWAPVLVESWLHQQLSEKRAAEEEGPWGVEIAKGPSPTPHPHHPALPTFNCGSTEEASSAPAKAPSVRLNLPSWTAFPREKMQASCLPTSVSWHQCGQSHTGWIRVLGNRRSGRGKEGKAHPCWSELSFRASNPGLQKEKASLQLCRVTRTACTRWFREIPVPHPLVSGRVWRRQPATWSTGGNSTPAPVPTLPQEGVAPSPGL